MDALIVPSVIVLSMLLMLFTGASIGFSLIGISVFFLFILLGPSAMLMVVAACFKQVSVEVYIAVPLFVLMASVFQFSGIGSSLYKAMHMYMASIRGGLLIGTIMICCIIGAISGVGATGTVLMGIVALPEMIERKYDKKMCLGAITIGGALGLLIPPSIMMIILGGYTQLSVGKLFLAGFMPGILWATLSSIYIAVRGFFQPNLFPAIPKERTSVWDKIKTTRAVIVPLLVIILLMGGIFGGIFTPTEAAGIGAAAAVVVVIAQKKFSISNMISALQQTLKISSMIMWLLVGGGAFSTLVTLSGMGSGISRVLRGVQFSDNGLVLTLVGINLLLGMFMDPIAIIMITLPIFLPMIQQSPNIDFFWFVALYAFGLILGCVTPPFGTNLFYIRGIASKDTTMREIFIGTIPYAIIGVGSLILCFIFPWFIIWLPGLLFD